ncbi:MAG: hypothetical protein IT327_20255 [Anaerolineae bacterium]|nr:hypothetical protein [Anaerolineae bacterium]
MMTTLPNILQRINWMLGASLVFRVLSAATTLSMTYFLAPAVYAEYSFAMSLSLLVALIAAAGLPDYIVSRARDGRDNIALLVWQSWLLNFIMGSLCLLAIYAVIFHQDLTEDGKWAILLINTATLFASSNVISQAALRTIHLVSTQARLMLFSITLSSVVLVFTAWYSASAWWIGLATLIVFSVIFWFHLVVLIRYQLITRFVPSLHSLWRLLRHVLPYGAVLILEMAIPVVASYLVLTRFDNELAGSFNLMITLLLSAMMIATALDQTFYPVLVSARREAAPGILAGYLLFSFFMVVPAFLAFFFHAQAIASISIFRKYEQLGLYLKFLAYLVPLHFIAKVHTVFYRLYDRQRSSVLTYALVLIWLLLRSGQKEVTPAEIGWFMVEGQAIVVGVLAIRLVPFLFRVNLRKKVGKLALTVFLAFLLTAWFANNFLALGFTRK